MTTSMETASKSKQPFLIADSSGLISLTSQIDQNYTKALRAARQLEGDPYDDPGAL